MNRQWLASGKKALDLTTGIVCCCVVVEIVVAGLCEINEYPVLCMVCAGAGGWQLYRWSQRQREKYGCDYGPLLPKFPKHCSSHSATRKSKL